MFACLESGGIGGRLFLTLTFSVICSAGSYNSENVCKQCPIGTWSLAEAISCTLCTKGRLSPPGSDEEEDCLGEAKSCAILLFNIHKCTAVVNSVGTDSATVVVPSLTIYR